MQFFALQLLFWVPFSSPAPLAYLVMTVNMLLAFMDLVVDGVMVKEARKDLKKGAQVLRSYSSTF